MRVLLVLSPHVGVSPITLSRKIKPPLTLKRRAHPEKKVPKSTLGLTGLKKHAPPSLPLNSSQISAGTPVEESLRRRCVPLSCVPPIVKPASAGCSARLLNCMSESVALSERSVTPPSPDFQSPPSFAT